MAWTFLKRMGSILGLGGALPGGPPGAEVSMGVFALAELDPRLCARLGAGAELDLECQGEDREESLGGRRVAVRHARGVVGFLPQEQAAHVARLLEQGARLGCRVVLAQGGQDVVRVRISILM